MIYISAKRIFGLTLLTWPAALLLGMTIGDMPIETIKTLLSIAGISTVVVASMLCGSRLIERS